MPTKKFKYFNPRTGSYSYRTARMLEGMAFLLEVVMDNEVYDLIKGNPMIQAISREEHCGEEFPKPVEQVCLAHQRCVSSCCKREVREGGPARHELI